MLTATEASVTDLVAWRLRSAQEVGAEGSAVSRPDFSDQDWLPARVPTTVLNTLIENGRHPDWYVGTRLAEIEPEPFRHPWWFRTVFEGRHDGTTLLGFDGINHSANVWLNGHLVAGASTVRGAYRRFWFDVSDHLEEANALAVEVLPPEPGDFAPGFVDWNHPPPDRSTGIFRPVVLRRVGSGSLHHPFARSQIDFASGDARLTLQVQAVNHAPRALEGRLVGRVDGRGFSQTVTLDPGESRWIELRADDHEALVVRNARLWWPVGMGEPALYEMDLHLEVAAQVSDVARIDFGIRQVEDYWTEGGDRGFRVNRRPVLIKGAGWTDELFLGDRPEKTRAQVEYARHAHLNCIRLEGIWGRDHTLYDACDRQGILLMVGWSCHWEHEQYLGKEADPRYGGTTSSDDIDLLARSWEDQLLWLRHHPSILTWAVASDKLPPPELERRYLEAFRRLDPDRPHLVSTAGVGSEQAIITEGELISEVSGSSGMKMLGPYDYTPPLYWFEDRKLGGAWGFNTETGPGAQPPVLESIRRMIPEEDLWPMGPAWDFHCALNEFDRLDTFREALGHRLGEAASLEEFALKAQILNYELMRPMFEAYRASRGRATGVIQWMLNAAWPKMYWQLYDYFLTPNAAYFAARKACQPLHLLYDYAEQAVDLVNEPNRTAEGLEAEVRVLSLETEELLSRRLSLTASPDSVARVLELPAEEAWGPTWFLDLRLRSSGETVDRNFYWLSRKPDVLDYGRRVEPWPYYTPSLESADFTSLDRLPGARLEVSLGSSHEGEWTRTTVTLKNPGAALAFFVEMILLDPDGRVPLVPVFWSDNYVSVLPGENRRLEVRHPRREGTRLSIRGGNLEARTVEVGG
jgi:exo-1,4-beta-D-glucosaminidase